MSNPAILSKNSNYSTLFYAMEKATKHYGKEDI